MTLAPSSLLTLLREHVPEWSLGLAGRGLLLRHLKNLSQISRTEVLANLTSQVARWRWQHLPWDPFTTAMCAQWTQNRSPLPDWTHAPGAEPGQTFSLALEAIVSADQATAARLWLEQGARSGHHVWLGETFLFFLQAADFSFCHEILKTSGLAPDHPLRLYLRALLAFHFDEPDQAWTHVQALPQEWQELQNLMLAELLLRQNDAKGVDMLTSLWRSMPWHTNLTLKLHDALAAHTTLSMPGAAAAVLVYSWNNADLLDQTLASLAQSDLGQAKIFLLDNGSADHTPQVAAAWATRLPDRLKTLRLPINIGAPAARNWLLQHPEVSVYRHIAFLDDDVLLPPGWLSTLLAVRQRLSPTATVGCRIMDRQPKNTVQMADVNLLDFEPDGEFQIGNAGSGELDFGLHHYTRPCLSVTGCCHLLDREQARAAGGFDLRFSPSQFDDFDFDLRHALAGGHAVYCGQLGIRHCQRSSLNQAQNDAKQGHIHGNMHKLNSKYTAEQKQELLRRNRDLLWNDLIDKTKELENA